MLHFLKRVFGRQNPPAPVVYTDIQSLPTFRQTSWQDAVSTFMLQAVKVDDRQVELTCTDSGVFYASMEYRFIGSVWQDKRQGVWKFCAGREFGGQVVAGETFDEVLLSGLRQFVWPVLEGDEESCEQT